MLQAIVYTLRSSYKELGLLIFLVSISGFIFARYVFLLTSGKSQIYLHLTDATFNMAKVLTYPHFTSKGLIPNQQSDTIGH